MPESTRSRAAALLALALALLGSAPRALAAQEFVVVAHPSLKVDVVKQYVVQRVFLKQADRVGGVRVTPVDQSVGSAVRDAFSKRVVRQPVIEVRRYWQQQLWAGGERPPETRTSDEEVLEFVRTTPGGIGYVSAAADTFGVKVLRVK
ncbi:hypothetical protein [Roseisolibacter agri]|uniref:Phosphate ABC transporter substrate-binding protein n=1 Tax=Roseisolibacter agri TaxID=2014610 RepID=A0AA37Q674_9BACT|nr:hypothetical protein [Roseisolibacter agri]GLC23731.1 hypothetical protein rosag_02440 [Roseisolibacter agri]